MSEGRTVLSLIEQREGIRIDESKLSARLRDRIVQLDNMLMVFDQLKVEVDVMAKKRRKRLAILFISLAFGVLGLAVGSSGSLYGFLDAYQAALSLAAAGGILILDIYIALLEKKLHWKEMRNGRELKGLTLDLDANLDRTYHEIISELDALRRQRAQRLPAREDWT